MKLWSGWSGFRSLRKSKAKSSKVKRARKSQAASVSTKQVKTSNSTPQQTKNRRNKRTNEGADENSPPCYLSGMKICNTADDRSHALRGNAAGDAPRPMTQSVIG